MRKDIAENNVKPETSETRKVHMGGKIFLNIKTVIGGNYCSFG